MEGLEVQGGEVAPPQGAGRREKARQGRCKFAFASMRMCGCSLQPCTTLLLIISQHGARCCPQVYTLGWNAEGKRLASGSVDQSVRITRVDDHCGVRSDAACFACLTGRLLWLEAAAWGGAAGGAVALPQTSRKRVYHVRLLPLWRASTERAAGRQPQAGRSTMGDLALAPAHQSAAVRFSASSCIHLQVKNEAELRGHSDGVTNVSWHPSHPDKLASIAGAEKSMRCVRQAGRGQGSSCAEP